LPGRSALDNVITPLLYARGAAFWQRRELAMDMLDRVGLAGRAQTLPNMLSGGEQQRVAIARALVRRPRLILADEPTGALDVDTGQAVMALLDTVATESGAALITITHDVNVAALARACYRLESGVLTPAEVPAGILA
jgi:putative ABC transport system ATP-binding protein